MLVVVQIDGAHRVQHGQVAWAVVARKHREVVVGLKDSSNNVGGVGWLGLELKDERTYPTKSRSAGTASAMMMG